MLFFYFFLHFFLRCCARQVIFGKISEEHLMFRLTCAINGMQRIHTTRAVAKHALKLVAAYITLMRSMGSNLGKSTPAACLNPTQLRHPARIPQICHPANQSTNCLHNVEIAHR